MQRHNLIHHNALSQLCARFALLALVLHLAILTGCSSNSPTPAIPSTKVVIIALDGLSWHTAAPLIERGELPRLAELAGDGCWGSLKTLKPTWTPIIFTTMATGKLPEAHGVKHFVDENGTPLSSNMRKVKALWNMASEAARTVVFVGWPVTWPAEEVHGVLVADNYGMRSEHRIHPRELEPELAGRLAVLEQQAPDPEVTRLLKATRQAIRDLGGEELKGGKPGETHKVKLPAHHKTLKGLQLHQVMNYIRARIRLEKEVSTPYFLELVARERPDLAAVYYSGTDMLQHICGARPHSTSTPGVKPNPKMLAAIDELYRCYDGIVGDLKDSISALPGYENCLFLVVSDHGFDLDSGDQPFALRRRPPAGETLPEVLTAGQESVFESIEPGTGDDQGWWCCRLDPDLPGRDRHVMLNRLVHYGQSGLESKRVFTTITHDHQPPGVFIIHGGPVANTGTLGDLSMDQIAPTVLALMGLPVARDMAGGPIPLPLVLADGNPAQLEAPSLVTTYDTEPRSVSTDALSSDSDEKIRQQLRLMGYIE